MKESDRVRRELTGGMPTGEYRLSEQRFILHEKRAAGPRHAQPDYEMYDFYACKGPKPPDE